MRICITVVKQMSQNENHCIAFPFLLPLFFGFPALGSCFQQERVHCAGFCHKLSNCLYRNARKSNIDINHYRHMTHAMPALVGSSTPPTASLLQCFPCAGISAFPLCWHISYYYLECRSLAVTSCPFCCSHSSTSKCPCMAAALAAPPLMGHGGRCCSSHCRTSRLPHLAAVIVVASDQGHGGSCSRNHWRTSKRPNFAAALQVISSHGQEGCCALSHCRDSRLPPTAAALAVQRLSS